MIWKITYRILRVMIFFYNCKFPRKRQLYILDKEISSAMWYGWCKKIYRVKNLHEINRCIVDTRYYLDTLLRLRSRVARLTTPPPLRRLRYLRVGEFQLCWNSCRDMLYASCILKLNTRSDFKMYGEWGKRMGW